MLKLQTSAIILAVGAVTGAGALLAIQGPDFFNNVAAAVVSVQDPETKIESVVINKIQSAGELSTITYELTTPVDISATQSIIGIPRTTSLTYMASGTVKAGVDLSQITEASIFQQGEQMIIQLPAPKILTTTINVKESYVVYSQQQFLGPDKGAELVDLAQEDAVNELQAKACSDAILTKANEEAVNLLMKLLSDIDGQILIQATEPDIC